MRGILRRRKKAAPNLEDAASAKFLDLLEVTCTPLPRHMKDAARLISHRKGQQLSAERDNLWRCEPHYAQLVYPESLLEVLPMQFRAAGWHEPIC